MTDETKVIGEEGGVDLDNVVSLKARGANLADQKPLETKGYPCQHYPVALVVDCTARTVECKRCKATVDLFEAIYLLARHSTGWQRVDHAKAAEQRIDERIREKMRTVKKLDAQIAKLRRDIKREGGT